MTGTCKWFDAKKGFGFIRPDDEKSGDVFVHHTAILAKGFKELHEGDRVEFNVIAGDKGPKAARVIVIGHVEAPPRRLERTID